MDAGVAAVIGSVIGGSLALLAARQSGKLAASGREESRRFALASDVARQLAAIERDVETAEQGEPGPLGTGGLSPIETRAVMGTVTARLEDLLRRQLYGRAERPIAMEVELAVSLATALAQREPEEAGDGDSWDEIDDDLLADFSRALSGIRSELDRYRHATGRWVDLAARIRWMTRIRWKVRGTRAKPTVVTEVIADLCLVPSYFYIGLGGRGVEEGDIENAVLADNTRWLITTDSLVILMTSQNTEMVRLTVTVVDDLPTGEEFLYDTVSFDDGQFSLDYGPGGYESLTKPIEPGDYRIAATGGQKLDPIAGRKIDSFEVYLSPTR